MENIDGRAGDHRNIACSAGLEDTDSLGNSQAEQVVSMSSGINAIYLSLYCPLHMSGFPTPDIYHTQKIRKQMNKPTVKRQNSQQNQIEIRTRE